MIGENIKRLRTKNKMTQKELADKLYVTSQAVSRWENGEVEPSLATVKDMANIFGVTVDELLGVSEQKKVEAEEVKYVYDSPQKQVLTLCEECNQPIYESSEVHRIEIKKHSGRTTNIVSKVLCESCYEEYNKKEQLKKEAAEHERLNGLKKRRVHSFIWSTLVAIIFFAIAINKFIEGNSKAGIILIVVGILGFCFISCWILYNNFVPSMWLEISGWSVRFPGVIFTLDLEGLFFLIFVKILFGILSFVISLLAICFATALSLAVSIFVYPFALGKNLKGIE